MSLKIYEQIPKFDETKYSVVQKPPIKQKNGDMFYGVELVELPPQKEVIEEYKEPEKYVPEPKPPTLEERIKALETELQLQKQKVEYIESVEAVKLSLTNEMTDLMETEK